ncbi:MAG: 7-cyano-7-deazaguanine synthase QueC [Lachnoclostridium sp.]|jgi:7-cyano-7-deazaguanine synthase|nr:7-cyano-7-deazaguanine synthase QueC [Lachnoclostridium sp.]
MRILVLSSGGIDSTTCLGLAVNQYGKDNVAALSLQYGQKHVKEIRAAEKISSFYDIKHIVSDLSSLFTYSNSALLRHSSDDIPKDSYENQQENSQEKPIPTYVPFRNGLFLSAAAGIALSLNYDIIYYGAHTDDSAGNVYPDCSKEFTQAMSTAIYEGSGHLVTVEAPFIRSQKADIVKAGLSLNVPYELTWSCYEGEEIPCGVCGTCIDRINAFKKNGVNDPLPYKTHRIQ